MEKVLFPVLILASAAPKEKRHMPLNPGGLNLSASNLPGALYMHCHKGKREERRVFSQTWRKNMSRLPLESGFFVETREKEGREGHCMKVVMLASAVLQRGDTPAKEGLYSGG